MISGNVDPGNFLIYGYTCSYLIGVIIIDFHPVIINVPDFIDFPRWL
jgi:hypothetical protein